jgi:hypothetical protein
MSNEQIADGVSLTTGKLYVHYSRKRRLLRLICWDKVVDELLFKEVDTKWDPMPKAAVALDRRGALGLVHKGRLSEVPETVRRQFMNNTPEALEATDAEWFMASRSDYELIKPLVQPERIAQTYSPTTGHDVLMAHTKVLWGELEDKAEKQKLQLLRRLLHRFAWFGLDANALLSLESTRGKSSELFVFTKHKRGTNNAAVKAGYGEKYAGRPTTKRDVELIEQALRMFFVAADQNYQQTYDRMYETLYLQATRTPAGELVWYPIGEDKRLSFKQFYRIARKLVLLHRLDAEKEAMGDRKEMLGRHGYATDLAPQGADVFDLDATSFNREAVAGFLKDGEVPNLGKLTVLLVFDRRSGKIVGWHVYSGNENWFEGYRLALFCALVSKKKQLEWLGIDDPDVFPDDENIACHFMYVDGGPGSSEAAFAAAGRLNIDPFLAPPATPYWKPNVEGGLGRAQKAQSGLPGGYARTSRARDREAKRNAKLFANGTPHAIEKKLVEHINHQNASRTKHHLLTHEMKMEGVEPTSNAIHAWYVRKMGGIQQRRFSAEQVYVALLDRIDRARVTRNGVWAFNGHYNSDLLKAFRASGRGPMYVQVFYHQSRPSQIFWLTPDGAVDALTRDSRAESVNGTMTTREIELYEFRDRAVAIVKQRTKKKHASITNEQRRIAAKGARGIGRQRTAPTEDTAAIRRLQAERARAERPMEQPHGPSLVPSAQSGQDATESQISGIGAAFAPGVAPAGEKESRNSTESDQSSLAGDQPVSDRPRRARAADMWQKRRISKDGQ